MAPPSIRKAMASQVEGIGGKAECGHAPAKLLIAATMLGQTVHEQDRGARVCRFPALVVQAQTANRVDLTVDVDHGVAMHGGNLPLGSRTCYGRSVSIS